MKKRTTRGQAIRLKCLDCCGGVGAEVRLCPATSCPLWVYRMGREEIEKEQKGGEQHG